jgi:RHS repeat-associated protein
LNETTFEYDAQGRMSIVTITTFAEDGTETRIEHTSYDYNADGIRVSALHEIDADADGNFETSKLTEYLNDPLNITGYSQVLKQTETNLETGEQANITYIIGRYRISQITVKGNTEQELHFTFDGHGSTRVLTDLAGAIVELYAFDAYGNAIGFDPSVALTEFLYSSEQFDSKIGQQYLRARYYDPATGRFNRLDSFFGNHSDPQSFHKYLYTHADPVNMVDPMGLFGGVAGIGVSMGISGNMRTSHTGAAAKAYTFSVATIGKFAFFSALTNLGIGAYVGNTVLHTIGKKGGSDGFLFTVSFSAGTHGFVGTLEMVFMFHGKERFQLYLHMKLVCRQFLFSLIFGTSILCQSLPCNYVTIQILFRICADLLLLE